MISRNLVVGGGINSQGLDIYVCSSKRYGSANKNDITAISDWLNAHQAISQLNVGQLCDANNISIMQ